MALKIKLEMLACGTCEALAQFNIESGYAESPIAWVIENALSEAEKSDLEGIRSISQPSLDLSMLSSVAPVAPVINQVVPSVESVSNEVMEDSTYHWDEIEQETNLYMGQLG
ncbi:MAG: hypothetical protein VKL42_16925 [Snowella sp.]|nr:hypothetical protein [Snowella sp.]